MHMGYTALLSPTLAHPAKMPAGAGRRAGWQGCVKLAAAQGPAQHSARSPRRTRDGLGQGAPQCIRIHICGGDAQLLAAPPKALDHGAPQAQRGVHGDGAADEVWQEGGQVVGRRGLAGVARGSAGSSALGGWVGVKPWLVPAWLPPGAPSNGGSP